MDPSAHRETFLITHDWWRDTGSMAYIELLLNLVYAVTQGSTGS